MKKFQLEKSVVSFNQPIKNGGLICRVCIRNHDFWSLKLPGSGLRTNVTSLETLESHWNPLATPQRQSGSQPIRWIKRFWKLLTTWWVKIIGWDYFVYLLCLTKPLRFGFVLSGTPKHQPPIHCLNIFNTSGKWSQVTQTVYEKNHAPVFDRYFFISLQTFCRSWWFFTILPVFLDFFVAQP